MAEGEETVKMTTIILGAAAAYAGYRFCRGGNSLPFGLGAATIRRPMLHQMFSNWGKLLEEWQAITVKLKATRSGGGARATLQRQRVDVQNQMRNTPEWKAAFAKCKARADSIPFGQPKIHPETLTCDVIVVPPSYEGGAE